MGSAARVSTRERRAACELAKDVFALGAAQVHHLLDVPPRGEGSALPLRLGGKLGFEALLPLRELALQRHLLEIVDVALQRLEG